MKSLFNHKTLLIFIKLSAATFNIHLDYSFLHGFVLALYKIEIYSLRWDWQCFAQQRNLADMKLGA